MDMHHLVAKRPPFGCRDPHPVLAAALPARRERPTSADKAMEGVVPADTAGVRQHHAHGGAGVAGRCGQDHDLGGPGRAVASTNPGSSVCTSTPPTTIGGQTVTHGDADARHWTPRRSTASRTWPAASAANTNAAGAGAPTASLVGTVHFGGAEGTRTPDPLVANEVRYQLRHSPLR